jgi:mono/diheme cytochrome c family protein
MRKRTVTRVTLFVCALLVVAAMGFAFLARLSARQPPADRPPAAAPSADAAGPPGLPLYETHCASCHVAEELADGLGTETGLGGGPGEIEAFLATHGGLEAHDNREIADYLRQLARDRQP